MSVVVEGEFDEVSTGAGPSFQGDLTPEGALPCSRFLREGGDFDFRVRVSSVPFPSAPAFVPSTGGWPTFDFLLGCS